MKNIKILALLLAAVPMAAQGQGQPQPLPDGQEAKVMPDGRAYTIRSGSLAAGSGNIAYQWYRNDAPIGGATDTSYTVPPSEAYGVNVEFKRKATLTSESCFGIDEGWSNAVLVSFTPNISSVITGSAAVCPNATGLTYSIPNVPGTAYTWVVPAGWQITAGQGTHSITVTAATNSGTISVTPRCAVNGYAGIARTLPIAISAAPAQPSEITANPAAICSLQEGISYSVTNVPGVTYDWVVPTANGWVITYGQGTSSITANAGTTGGTVSVTPTACGSLNGTARTLLVALNAAPTQPSTITASRAAVCEGETNITYSVTNVTGVTYNWTVPAGWSITGGQETNSITATAGAAGGNVTVTPSTECNGNGTARTLAVSMATAPAQPSVIATSSPVVCFGQTGITYSVTAVPFVSYAWTVPAGWNIFSGQGTNSISVSAGSAGGSVSVTPSNCGSLNGTASTMPVGVGAPPAQPSVITGNTTVCSGATQTYSVAEVQGVNYIWAVPQSWTITAGQGSSSITVTTGSAAGTVSVTPNNCGGNGTARTLATTMGSGSAPAQPGTITLNPGIYCINQSGVRLSVGNTAGVSYQWTVPSGWAITGGQGTSAITVRSGANGGNITVTPSVCGSSGASRMLAIAAPATTSPAQPGTITANPPTVCERQADLTYSVTEVPGLTYSWTVPAGWAVTAGQGTSTLTAAAGLDGGTIGVTASAAGCSSVSAQRTMSVSLNSTPAQPSAITQSASAVTVGHTGLVYSVTAVPGIAYTWAVPQGWTITAGQGTNSIVATAGTAGSATLSVTPSACGNNGSPQTLAVTVNATPPQPSAITAPTVICAGQTGITYSVTNVPGTVYSWTVPAGWEITAGQGFSSITVTAGNAGGNIEVTPSVNGVAGATPRTLTVTLTGIPAQPALSTDLNINPASVCTGSSGLVYAVTNVSGIIYNWSVPAGWEITGGQGTNSITATAGGSGGSSNVSVAPYTACGDAGTPRSIAVSVSATCGSSCGSGNGTSIAGLCWANRNVGASGSFASTSHDYSQFYQWNRTTAWGATGTVSDWNATSDNSATWTNNPCPSGWRIPTQAELTALHNASSPAGGTWAEASERGNTVAGRFYGHSHATCAISSMTGCIFLPAVGYRNYNDGGLTSQGSCGSYWSDNLGSTSSRAYYLDFGSTYSNPIQNSKAYGMNLRCVQN